ncbi:MAG: hypothetical protein AAGI01_03445 [Myxococcota bacterium]
MKTAMLGATWRTCFVVLGVMCAVGCADDKDPRTPEGAYLLFRDALLSENADMLWERCDKETHAYFQGRYEALVRMDATIEEYLPQADHRIARRQSGVVLLDEVKNGRALFDKIFEPAKLPKDQAHMLGSEIKEVRVAEDSATAKVVTRGEQKYILVAQEVGEEKTKQWFVKLVQSTAAVKVSMKWLDDNESALTQTVDDLIAEERERRETVIAELMNL